MKRDRLHRRHAALPLSIGLLFAAPSQVLADPPPAARPPDTSRTAPTPRLALPAAEPETSTSVQEAAGRPLANPFASGTATGPNVTSGQVLVAPVTVNANTASDGLTVTQTGGGRAITGLISNSKSTISALKGITNGSGAAVAGANTGTTGPAGQFQITNVSSSQAGIVSSTTGKGSAIQAIQGNTGDVDAPAILGQHNQTGSNRSGIGVEGDGDRLGVNGVSPGGIGVQGVGKIGVYGKSDHDTGVYATSGDYYGLFASSTGSYGAYGYSVNSIGVFGYSANSVGVYGQSDGTYAGYFNGAVYVAGVLTANSYAASSDRNLKQAIEPVDTEHLLDRIAAMPIASWDFQTQPGVRHIGPMAQDFRAAFGLGADDKHIDLVDGVGVSLAAIQGIQRQVKSRDARIESLESQLQGLRIAVDARLAALENGPGTTTATGPSQP